MGTRGCRRAGQLSALVLAVVVLSSLLLAPEGASPPVASGIGPAVPAASVLPAMSTGGRSSPSATEGSTMDWVPWTPAAPSALEGASFAANSSSGEGVLFGGTGGSGLSNATYLYSEASNLWTPVAATDAPPARSDFGFAANEAGDSAILFGGRTNASTQAVSNETWVFDFGSQRWTELVTPVAPAARQDPAFAVGGGIALLYGGWAQNVSGIGQITYSDTWALNTTTDTWDQYVTAGPTPGAVHGASLIWVPTLGEFLLFGGCYPCSANVWTFSPTDPVWRELTPLGGVPPPRMNAVWVWDEAEEVAVLFGGTNGTATYDSTYYFQPSITAWTSAATSAVPSARYSAAADFLDLEGNSSVLLTGGAGTNGPLGDVWRLAATANLTVKVGNAATGVGIANATVQVGPSSDLLTNATGFATAFALPSNVTAVTASQAGYSPRSTSVWLPPGSNVEISLSLAPVPPATVVVEVRDPSGAPLSNASVGLSYLTRPVAGSPQRTNASGGVIYTDVPAGNYTLAVQRTGDHPSTTSVDAASGSTVPVNITLSPLYLLLVRTEALLPNGTLAAAAGVGITVAGRGIGSTGPGGTLNATLDLLGPVTVAGSLYGFLTTSVPLNVTFTGVGYANLTLRAEPYPTVTIAILGQRGNGPGFQVRGANVTVTNLSALSTGPYRTTFVTNIEGTVTFSLPTGNYSVSVSAPGFISNTSIPRLIAPPGANLSRTYYLSLIGFSNIVVLVLSDGSGNPPVGSATVDLHFVGTNLSSGLPFPNETRVSKTSGYANFSGVPQAKVLWVVVATGFEPANGSFEVEFGSPSNRFVLYLVPIPPPTYVGLHIFPVASDAIWSLILFPIAGLLGALVYLTVLRNPGSRAREVREEAEADRSKRREGGNPP